MSRRSTWDFRKGRELREREKEKSKRNCEHLTQVPSAPTVGRPSLNPNKVITPIRAIWLPSLQGILVVFPSD